MIEDLSRDSEAFLLTGSDRAVLSRRTTPITDWVLTAVDRRPCKFSDIRFRVLGKPDRNSLFFRKHA